ncbi:MAG: sigma-54-dependent Fis family transcriptional regulator [Spartobacteria bacterium]|nr:sigma-54-dependent Fis family transcriptional regulator [Spartobacteria bacterium]
MNTARVLIVEDDPDGCRSLMEAIEDMGVEVVTAATGEDGLRAYSEGPFDVVLSDLVLPDIDGIAVLTRIRQVNTDIPVIIMTAYGTVSSSVSALKAGAYDYITKPLDLDDIQSKVSRAVEAHQLRTRVKQLSNSFVERYTAGTMVAEASAMKDLTRKIQAVAATNATVLVYGESGTGKELVARALHADGRRADGPFVAVNCGAFSESLLESELFGHEKGAFTGASSQHKGAFERADGGTLFLDEIGDAPKSVQVKLLRVLEEREIIRVGGQHSFHVDVRLISATNQDLDALVEDGLFREDLLYRLKVVKLEVPPLRDRKDDIRLLADRFIVSAGEEHGRHIVSVAPDYYAALRAYDWPGNVRQLRNVVESSVVMATESTLRAVDLQLGSETQTGRDTWQVPDGMTFEELEKEILTQLLRRNDGNRTLTADKLGISRRTIQRKIQDYNLPF